jgi:hypothetical protein
MERKSFSRDSPGFFPLHASSVALILNPLTGYVSPQFHQVFDPTFTTVSGKDGNQTPSSLWQAKCGFTRTSGMQYAHTHKNEAPPDIIDPGMLTDRRKRGTASDRRESDTLSDLIPEFGGANGIVEIDPRGSEFCDASQCGVDPSG